MPPSNPPDRLVARTRRSPSRRISSCTCVPRSRAFANADPISTPFIACTLDNAPINRADKRRSHCTCDPNPGGTFSATTSVMPPTRVFRFHRRANFRVHFFGSDRIRAAHIRLIGLRKPIEITHLVGDLRFNRPNRQPHTIRSRSQIRREICGKSRPPPRAPPSRAPRRVPTRGAIHDNRI